MRQSRSLSAGQSSDCSEDEQRHTVEQFAEFVGEERQLSFLDGTAKGREGHARDECGDEAGASQRCGDAVRECGSCDGQDLQPGRLDQLVAASVDDRCCCDDAGEHASDDSPTDLLHDQPHRVRRSEITGVCLGDCEHDEEQRHADAVVEAAFDVQTLADARR